MAPDTRGDGTGCDNMTAVIIKFKPSVKDLKDVIVDADAVLSVGSSTSSGSSTVAEKNNCAAETSKQPSVEESSDEPAAKRQKLNGSQ